MEMTQGCVKFIMNVKVVLGHYTNYDYNSFQVKTVDRVINTTVQVLTSGVNEVTTSIQLFWVGGSNHPYGKFIDYYEVPDVFQPELLTEQTR